MIFGMEFFKSKSPSAFILSLLGFVLLASCHFDKTPPSPFMDLELLYWGTSSTTFTTGQPVDLRAEIINGRVDGACIVGQPTPATENRLSVYVQQGNDWALVGENTYTQPSVRPNETSHWTDAVTINQPGYYRFDFETDWNNLALECDELNNQDSIFRNHNNLEATSFNQPFSNQLNIKSFYCKVE